MDRHFSRLVFEHIVIGLCIRKQKDKNTVQLHSIVNVEISVLQHIRNTNYKITYKNYKNYSYKPLLCGIEERGLVGYRGKLA
jgi:hypothetical protein